MFERKHKNELVRQRTARAIKNHFWTLIKLNFYSALVTVLWYFTFWRWSLHMAHGDSEIYLMGILVFESATWVLMATGTYTWVQAQQDKMMTAIKRADIATIVDLKDDHIPLIIPFLLIALSIVLMVTLMLMPYEEVWKGAGAIYTSMLTICFYARIIYELEDPLEDGWPRAQLLKHHPKLLEQSSEAVFARRWRRRLRRRAN